MARTYICSCGQPATLLVLRKRFYQREEKEERMCASCTTRAAKFGEIVWTEPIELSASDQARPKTEHYHPGY